MAVAESRQEMDRAGVKLLGCVLTRHRRLKGEGYYHEGPAQDGARGVLDRLRNAGWVPARFRRLRSPRHADPGGRHRNRRSGPAQGELR